MGIDSTVDLALSGYSALFDGFSILVGENDFAAADKVLTEFLAEAKKVDAQPTIIGIGAGFTFARFFQSHFPD